MDRSYKKADTVVVYVNQHDKDNRIAKETIKRVPYSRHGFDYYMFGNYCFPGYVDWTTGVDACIILTDKK